METSGDKLIFCETFPHADLEELLKESERTCKDSPGSETMLPKTGAEMRKLLAERFTFVPRENAEKQTEHFISSAINVCRNYQIDTKITRGDHSVAASLFIYFGYYNGHVKQDIDALLKMGDDVSLISPKNSPNSGAG